MNGKPETPAAPAERDDMLHGAAHAVAAAEGDAVFRDLVRYLAKALQVDVAFIALPVESDPRRLRMLAFVADGRLIEDFEYPMAGTPCETVIGQTYRLYPSGLQASFPLDTDFKAMDLGCYAGYPLFDGRGKALGLIAVAARKSFASPIHVESILKIFAARAVTEIERRRADQALRLAEASYQAIFDAAEDAIFVHDWDSGAIVDANSKACEMYGYSREELRTVSVGAISLGEPPYTATEAHAWIEQAKRNGSAELEWRRRNRDGSLHWDEVRLKTAVINGRPHVLAFIREITARKQAEADLRASEARYRLLFEMESDAILLIDVETLHILDANPAAAALYGYTREELLELGVVALSAQPASTVQTIHASPATNARVPLRYHRRKDGTAFPVEIATNTFDLNGRPTMLAAIRDVTERQRAEEARAQLEAQLRQAQKMEAIGHLSGGIAHDFNNILTSVLGYVALAAEREAAQADAKLGHYLGQAETAVQRARDLIRQMLTFSRGQRGEPRAISLGKLVHESTQLLASTLPSSIELSAQIARDLPRVMIDPVHLGQILLNLCINARDAMGQSGAIRIAATLEDVPQAICSSCRKRVQGTFVALAVSDNGPGIAPAVLERMFEPFFTTKEVGKGSGMGLATVHGIVHEYGGHVCVHSAPDAGATFKVLLLPHEHERRDAPIEERRERTEEAVPRLQGRVLVVDDDDMVASLLEEMLQGWGLAVTVLRNPLQAHDWFVQDPARIDLVLTDQTMPKLTGIELAQRLTLVRPELPVVLYSGYGSPIDRDAARASGICALIAKPMEPRKLFEVLREHLPAGDDARA